ncbi:hypothetical protein LJB85_02225 [Porphyromonadaceae bacterium OttesenSCG-928-L07]|nr:hypothetical protein [Porphyromonadaceae bacterium OttesenSCG-928-L07]MDL2251987.1 hypothetical protein [Odoribacter sp. OttesenSCG-928-J03]MDL2330819.1 hypothetical protein [Odoribacter sp. OttesenSCG-928-A06]
MKKVFLLPALLLLSIFFGNAQEVTTMWPYVYADFVNGTVYYKDGAKLETPMNIHLYRSTLHYLEGDIIREADSDEVLVLDISGDKYYSFKGQMLKVLAGNENSFLAELTLADLNTILETEGAYGSSSNTQSTRNLSSIEVGGITVNRHMEVKMNKEDGELLAVIKKYYIVADGEIYLATRKGIESKLPENRKQEFKTFVKDNRITWNDTKSLAKFLHFFKF